MRALYLMAALQLAQRAPIEMIFWGAGSEVSIPLI